jgi:Mrp family chromosome partitioning ATPase/uncharacterized protein involved in exopolysaccharide biosynthesis
MELKDYLRLLGRRWPTLVVAAALIFAGLQVHQLAFTRHSYQAATTVLFKSSSNELGMTTQREATVFLELLPVKSRIRLLKANDVLQATASALTAKGLPLTEEELDGAVSASESAPDGTAQITVTHMLEEGCLQIIETLLQKFLEIESELLVKGFRRQRELLDERIEEQKRQIEEDRQHLADEIQKDLGDRGIFDPELQGQVKAQLLVDLERGRQQSLQRIHRLEYQLKTHGTLDTAANPLPVAPAAQRMAELLPRLRSASKRYTERHPDILAMKAELEELRPEAISQTEQSVVLRREEGLLEVEYLKEFVGLTERICHVEYKGLSDMGQRKMELHQLREKISSLQVRLLDNEERLALANRGLASWQADRKSTVLVLKKPKTLVVFPKNVLPMPLMVVVSLVVGVFTAFLRDGMDTTLRDAAGIHRHLNLPVLASLQRVRSGSVSLLQTPPRSPLWESFQSLGLVLLKTVENESHPVFVLTSSSEGTGKSFASSNLAIALATERRKVLLIDGDMRNPVQHQIFSLDNSVGLSTYLSGRLRARVLLDQIVDPRSGEASEPPPVPDAPGPLTGDDVSRLTQGIGPAIQPTSVPNLFVMPAGLSPANPVALMDLPEAEALVCYARANYDVTVFDTPPLMLATDGLLLAARADLVALLVAYGKTPRETALAGKHLLEKAKARLGGAILNFVSHAPSEYYYYNHNHGRKTTRS